MIKRQGPSLLGHREVKVMGAAVSEEDVLDGGAARLERLGKRHLLHGEAVALAGKPVLQ